MKSRAILAVAVLALGCTAKEQAPASAAAGPQEYSIHAVEHVFHAKDTISAGMTTIAFANGGKEYHHAQLIRLDSAKTLADLQEAMKKPGPLPAWAVAFAGPGVIDPGASLNLTMDVPAGNYAVLCFVDIPGKVPHFAKGMVKTLTVVPAAAGAAAVPLPASDITIALSDFSFQLSTPVTAGKHTFKVTSAGPQDHEVVIVKFAPGKTLDDFGKWMAKPEGPAPAQAMGGSAGLKPGVELTFSADITPGDYAFICVVPDPKDGKPHIEKGMVMPFKVQ